MAPFIKLCKMAIVVLLFYTLPFMFGLQICFWYYSIDMSLDRLSVCALVLTGLVLVMAEIMKIAKEEMQDAACK